MDEELKLQAPVNEQPEKTRRAFVKTAAQVAVTAPAMTLLLATGSKPATPRSTATVPA
jgi:hypothetical protein